MGKSQSNSVAVERLRESLLAAVDDLERTLGQGEVGPGFSGPLGQAVQAALREAFQEAGEIEAIKRKLLISPAEAARIVPYSVQALAQMRHRGVGPIYSKDRDKVLYEPGELLEWARARRGKMRA